MTASYGAVSFSGVTKAGPFYDQIWSGRKRQTLRTRRKDNRPHVKPGHAFNMYWMVRQPKSKKPVHYIGTAMCTGYRPIMIVDFWNDEVFAKRDGFLDLDEFRDWFYSGWRDVPVLDEVIEAYHELKELHVDLRSLGAEITSGRWLTNRKAWGESAVAEFLQLEYMLIEWDFPLLESGQNRE